MLEGETIMLTFQDFDIEFQSSCNYDYIEVCNVVSNFKLIEYNIKVGKFHWLN